MSTPHSYQPVTHERHAHRRWFRYTSYGFAAREVVLPLLGPELSRAALSLPIAFVRSGDVFIPTAVLGVEDGKNLLVSPDGRWLGAYIPATLRGYPFALLPTSDGQHVLCVDQSSGLVHEAAHTTAGEGFFDEQGNLSAAVKLAVEFLQKLETYRPVTLAASKALQDAGLIQPWPITVQASGQSRQIEGLYRVDEQAMYALPDPAFLGLRASGALLLAYTQLLSMQHLGMIQALAQEAATLSEQQLATGGELDLSFLKGDTLRFL